MGTVTDHHPCPRESTEKNTRREEQKMCHPSQTSPNPNQAWQGVYPDLSAFNDLFSRQAAPQPNPQPSPWISFLGSLGLQPIPQEQLQQQGSAQKQPSAPPAPEQEPAGETFAGSNVYSQRQPPQPGSNQAGHQGSNTQSPPGGAQGCYQDSNNPRRSAQSCNFSCNSPHIKQLFQAATSRLLHFSSVATRASVTFFCAIAFFCILSSLPGFLIHSALYLVLAPSLLGLPLPALLAGHVLYSAVTFLHPLCALVLLLPCLHRLHVRRLPLANPANWGPRFTGGNAAWTHHQHQGHQHQQ